MVPTAFLRGHRIGVYDAGCVVCIASTGVSIAVDPSGPISSNDGDVDRALALYQNESKMGWTQSIAASRMSVRLHFSVEKDKRPVRSFRTLGNTRRTNSGTDAREQRGLDECSHPLRD